MSPPRLLGHQFDRLLAEAACGLAHMLQATFNGVAHQAVTGNGVTVRAN